MSDLNPSRRTRTLLTVVVWIIAGAFLVPSAWIVASSLRPQAEVFRYARTLSWRTFVPAEFTLEHFATLLGGPFARALANSLVVATVTVVVGLLVAAYAAFALSALEVKGRNLVFAVVVVSFLVPFDAVAVPLASRFRDLGLANTYSGLILPGLGHGLAIFLLRQFFANLPVELREAARVDGASWRQVLFRIYLPLSRPALIGAGLILFMFQWQAYLWPLLVATENRMQVGPIAIARMFGEFETNFGALFAGSFLLALIPAVMLLVFQGQFVSSVARSGLKE